MNRLISLCLMGFTGIFGNYAAFAGVPAETLQIDLSGAQFQNYCQAEPVTVASGSLHLAVRQDFGGDQNGVHLLSRTAGNFRATGDNSGDEYLLNISANAPSILPVSVSNYVNGSGSANLLVHIEMVNLTRPDSGVSAVKAVIVGVTDGTGDFNQRVLQVGMDCLGR